ncbi:MAG: hypothetical protein QM535_09570 [Limnohabitans sp.]|nr:hypothetical protein [Limnohabitans sp.]
MNRNNPNLYLKLLILAKEAKEKYIAGEITYEELHEIATQLLLEGQEDDNEDRDSFYDSIIKSLM